MAFLTLDLSLEYFLTNKPLFGSLPEEGLGFDLVLSEEFHGEDGGVPDFGTE